MRANVTIKMHVCLNVMKIRKNAIRANVITRMHVFLNAMMRHKSVQMAHVLTKMHVIPPAILRHMFVIMEHVSRLTRLHVLTSSVKTARPIAMRQATGTRVSRDMDAIWDIVLKDWHQNAAKIHATKTIPGNVRVAHGCLADRWNRV